YSGLLQEELFDLIQSEDKRQIKEHANRKFAFPSYEVNEFSYDNEMQYRIPVIKEHVQAQVTGTVSESSKRQIIQLGWLPNPMVRINQDTERTEPLVLDKSFTITDTIVVPIPVGIAVEQLPASLKLTKPFGKFDFEASKQEDKVIIIRHFEQYKGVYEAAIFDEYQKMYRNINAEVNNSNIVLVKN